MPFIKNGVKEGKTSLMSFLTVRLNSSVSMAGTEVTVVFKTLKPSSFQLSTFPLHWLGLQGCILIKDGEKIID